MRGGRNEALGWCEDCEKLSYIDRKSARSVARQHPEHKSVYECPARPQLWHVGGLPDVVMQGQVTRGEFYQQKDQHRHSGGVPQPVAERGGGAPASPGQGDRGGRLDSQV